MKLKGFVIAITVMLLSLLVACGTGQDAEPEQEPSESQEQTNGQADAEVDLSDVEENLVITITMENGGEIVAELYPTVAPNTVANFISLVEDGFYDGLIFHRVIPGFMIQGGDPDGTGTGGPGYAIAGEFSANGFENDLAHDRGVLSMARSQDPDSAGSQFFIMVAESSHLDGEYASFGEVTEGMDVVDEIVATERNDADKPLEDQRMETVTVDTKGYDYPEPVKE
ncbi:peptidylprolyl isomerase [Aquibacillus sediminis]|uniref:peptidylprolyl isomerase n=1 Tax=Aquibacillus sediminis TaxID=2574734 RepID=UPI001108CDD0|nr:peptidylprolyl isomerase [Aquibacillus sediminis]